MLIIFCLLCGCTSGEKEMERSLSFREKLLASNGCSFSCRISADYGQQVYTFLLRCSIDSKGTLSFQAEEPESISGIAGRISSAEGALVFDDAVLAFPPLAEGEIPPVRGPWILMNALRNGYISSCGQEEAYLLISIDDSYCGTTLRADIWIDEKDTPVHGEIYWQGNKILTLEIIDFQFV